MANPSLPHVTKRMDHDGVHFEVEGVIVDDKVVVKAQESTIADAASATAAAASVTGAVNAALTTLALTYAGGGSASATPADLADGSTYATDFSKLEDHLATFVVELNSNRADTAAIITQADKSTVDIAAAKVEFDKLLTDVALIRTACNSILTALENHGLLADA